MNSSGQLHHSPPTQPPRKESNPCQIKSSMSPPEPARSIAAPATGSAFWPRARIRTEAVSSSRVWRHREEARHRTSITSKTKSFYLLAGNVTFWAGGQTIHAKPGDFIHIPRGTVHSLKNEWTVTGRVRVIISPARRAGGQQFFEESFILTTDRNATPPPPETAWSGFNRPDAARFRNGSNDPASEFLRNPL